MLPLIGALVLAVVSGAGHAAAPVSASPGAAQRAQPDAAVPDTAAVGIDWRRVEVAPDITPRAVVVAGDRLWVAAVRGDVDAAHQGPALFSTVDGERWDEHDLGELGVPRATRCGTDDVRICHPANLLLLGGDGVFLIIDNATNDEPTARDRWVVSGDGAHLEAFDIGATYGAWPAPDEDGNVLVGGRPTVGVAADGRALTLGQGRRGPSAPLVVQTIDPGVGAQVTLDPTQPFAQPRQVHIVQALRQTDLGYVAVGAGPGSEAILLPSVWRSADGAQWSAQLLNAAHDVAGDAVYSVYDLADGPAGLVVSGAVRPEGFVSDVVLPAFWQSPDGEVWHEAVLTEFGAGVPAAGSPVSIVALPDRYVSLVVSGIELSLATSPDGLTWSVLDPAPPPMNRLVAWGDGLVATDARHVLISAPGFTRGVDAREPVDAPPVTFTSTTDPAGPDDVGRFWRSVDLPAGLSVYGRDVSSVVTVGTDIWVLAQRDDATLTLLSSPDGSTWTDHDLAAAGVPTEWLVIENDFTDSVRSAPLLIPDGDAVVLLLGRYPLDNETIPPELLTVRSDGTMLDVRLPESFTLGAWPGPSDGDDLRYGAPSTGIAHQGRLVLAGAGQWWEPYATGDRSIVVTVIEPDGHVTFVAQNGPPFGGRNWQLPVAMRHVGDQLMLIGTAPLVDAGDGPRQLATWTSNDGIEWSGPHLVGHGGGLWDDPAGVVNGTAGMLAYGATSSLVTAIPTDERPSPAMWWHSPDGTTWTRADATAAGSAERLVSTWATADGYRAIVTGRAGNVLLGSTDGVTWTRIAWGVPLVSDVQPWGDGLVGHADGRIYLSRP